MMKNPICLMLAATCTLATGAGCTREGNEAAPTAGKSGRAFGGTPAATGPGIIVTNGASINGPLINGGGAPGSEVYGKDVTGSNALGIVVRGLTLQGSVLASVRVRDGAVLSGAALVGTTFATHAPDGSHGALRIDAHAAKPSAHHPGSTVHHFALSYRPSGATAWTPVCGEQDHERVLVIPLAGRWSYAQGAPGGGARLDEPDWITFACDGYALHKCVGLGYEPWTSAGGVRLDAYHQACTRAQRADYCGDGRSYTEKSRFINIFDKLGIQDDTESWALESRWDAGGARCLLRPRIQGGAAPDCVLPKCEPSPAWGDALIVTEAP